MGMFSFLDKPFRTGATQAAKNAKKMGAVSLEEQGALREEIGGIYDPRMQAGEKAFGEVADFYSGNQQPIIDQAMSSPFMSQLVNQGEESIARNSQMTGGFRTGTTQENLAGNSQNVLMNLVQQMLSGKQGIANQGSNATDAYTTAMQNIVAGQGATRGGRGEVVGHPVWAPPTPRGSVGGSDGENEEKGAVVGRERGAFHFWAGGSGKHPDRIHGGLPGGSHRSNGRTAEGDDGLPGMGSGVG